MKIFYSRNEPLKYSTMENSHYSSQQIKHTVKMTNLNRSKRQLQSRSWDNVKRFLDSESQPTTVSEFILWGPTG
ncbi:hypothetical protein XENTR_v10019029 [Xenopus tropicalis]|nr:hypothetical protein XENTR_v10019029 [Xenopus tropicalis]